MEFAAILDQLERNDYRQVDVPAEWAQGRATFGGLVAALVYSAMRSKVSDGRPVRSLAISFVGPVAPGAVQLEVEVLREGRAVVQVEGRALQDGQVAAVVLGSFGAPRESAVAVTADPAPQVAAVEKCQQLPFIPKLSPTFAQYFEYRWAIGHMPFTGSRERKMGGWMRFSEPQGKVDEAQLLGLVDAWPPAVLPMLESPAPGSSLTWTIEFVQPAPAVSPEDYLLYEAEVEHARDGYGHVAARVWNAQGELVALSRQTVTVFG